MSDRFRIGDKVKLPIDKISTCSSSWRETVAYIFLPARQDFIYVSNIYESGIIAVSATPGDPTTKYRAEDLEPYEDNLPEKWCIEKTDENYEEINKWFNTLPNPNNYTSTYGYMHYPAYAQCKGRSLHNTYHPQVVYTEITIEQFREITKNNTKMEKKIVGYKAPMDLYNGIIKKGTIYRKYNTQVYNVPEIANVIVPKEIVETWEPVYEPEEIILKLEDKGIEVKIGKGYIRVDGEEFNLSVIQYLLIRLTTISINGYDIAIPQVKIGCTLFTLQEIQEVIDTYNKLNQ